MPGFGYSDATGYRTVLDNDRVRGCLLMLEPGRSTGLVTRSGPGIRVVLGGGEIEQAGVALKRDPAQVAWRAKPNTLTVKNTGSTTVELVEFELK